jgi:cytochrome c oxidase cbb3-type subunit 2
MVRPFRNEELRYQGEYSKAGEYVYDHPFLWGSKRTGPDLQRVGGRYSDEWHRAHLNNPRDVVPASVMPGYPWLAQNSAEDPLIQKKMQMFKDTFGFPYTDDEIKSAPDMLKGKTEADAIIAYLQSLGTAIKIQR